MGSIDRYIFRTSFGAFLMVLVSLTAIIWVTHALREIDLMTNQRQTVLVFVGITALLIPMLVLVIAPLALVVAISYTLNRLNGDSEIVVMTSAGMSPWRTFRPFLVVALVVSAMVAFISFYLAPRGLRELHDWGTKVRTDLVTNIVQPGRFTTIERGLTFHIRERRQNGLLVGIFIDDRRDPAERATFLAEEGQIVKNERGTFLVMQNGSLQRYETRSADPTIVRFERYGLDLSRFNAGDENITYSVRERYVWDLVAPDPNDPEFKAQPGHFRAEFHDRLVAPLYPIAFVLIAFAFLGSPRTTRQTRGLSMVLAVAGVAALRLTGFAAIVVAVNAPIALIFLYFSVVAGIGAGIYLISRTALIEMPNSITTLTAKLTDGLRQRLVRG